MALGILGAYGGLNKKEVPDCLFVGELSLDGGIRGVRGALPIAIEARGKKICRLIVPELNAREAEIQNLKEKNALLEQRLENLERTVKATSSRP
jgi:predicted ATPase with chaperone activity